MSGKKAVPTAIVIVLVILALLVTCCLLSGVIGGAGTLWFFTLGDPDGLALESSYPSYITPAETFELEIICRNIGEKNIKIREIRFSQELLDAAAIDGVQPASKRSQEYPPGGVGYFFEIELAPGEEQIVTFELQADTEGEHIVSVKVFTAPGHVEQTFTLSVWEDEGVPVDDAPPTKTPEPTSTSRATATPQPTKADTSTANPTKADTNTTAPTKEPEKTSVSGTPTKTEPEPGDDGSPTHAPSPTIEPSNTSAPSPTPKPTSTRASTPTPK